MSCHIQLDHNRGDADDYYTNLDFVRGRVCLRLPRDESIASVVVKLEGESKTQIDRQFYSNRQDKSEVEIHKLIYKVCNVFPPPGMGPAPSSLTLKAGEHIFPFDFKIPLNNNCLSINSAYTNLSFNGLRVEMARNPEIHVKRTLPPSLNGFPGLAEIRYYVKATIARPSFYKENYRSHADILFLPIEPPRPHSLPAVPIEEACDRRHFEYNAISSTPPGRSLFGNLFSSNPPTPSDKVGQPPRITIDARIPAVVTCNEPLPLRVLVTKESDFTELIHLQSLEILVIAYTHIRAHELVKLESGSWAVSSLSNLNTPIGTPADAVGCVWELDRNMWSEAPLPRNVAPSFESCNIRRHYEIEVRVGLTYGRSGTKQSQLTIHPLRMSVSVYSGIAPPTALLSTMSGPSSPFADVPPSYEDVLATELAPVDGQYNRASSPGTPGLDEHQIPSKTAPYHSGKVP